MEMEVSYIISEDELFTLISMTSNHTDAGRLFCAEVLSEAKVCDLDGLVDKNIAVKRANNQVELTPVFNMFIDSLAQADSIQNVGNSWIIQSPWITLRCEAYPFIEKHIKITPMKEGRINENTG